MSYRLEHLEELEAESIYVLREAFAQFENPCILFSGGKDSIVVTHLAVKAFYPAKIPFPLVHIDTGHNFDETIAFRDELVDEIGAQLVVGSVQDAIDKGLAQDEKGVHATRNTAQIPTLLEPLKKINLMLQWEARRRDEEKARCKRTLFFSLVMTLVNGIPKINDQNYGIFLTVRKNSANILEFFQSAIGLKWTFGNILKKKILIYQVYIFPMKEKLFGEEIQFSRIHLI